MRVVVGLGNPGAAYAHTRHNVGFMVVEELARRWQMRLSWIDGVLRATSGQRNGRAMRLVEPMRFMNRSGEALATLDPLPEAAALIVVHDDLDLDCGRVCVKCGGGTGGHRGLESIVACFGEGFTRVRVGIGRPPQGQDVTTFVLSACERVEERAKIDAAICRAADAVEFILRDGEDRAMNVFNRRLDDTAAAVAAASGRD